MSKVDQNGKRLKTGGRVAGTPNKRTLDIQQRLDEMSCDPIAGMAHIAMDEDNPPELRGRMYSELASYVAPKRKAIDLSGSLGVQPVKLALPANCTPLEASQAYARLISGTE